MNKGLIIFLRIVSVVIACALLVYNLFFAEDMDFSRVAKSLVVIIGVVAATFGIEDKGKRRDYRRYEGAYKHIIEGAFSEDSSSYKKLLKAVTQYSIRQYKKAFKMLDGLQKKCKRNKDYSVIFFFKGLCLTGLAEFEKSAQAFEKSIQYDGANSMAWSNLGYIYKELEKFQEAYEANSNAIRYDANNAYAYCHMAELLIEVPEPEEALNFALKAIELNNKLTDAMWVASIALKLMDCDEESQKYCRMYELHGGESDVLKRVLKNIEIAREEAGENPQEENEELGAMED